MKTAEREFAALKAANAWHRHMTQRSRWDSELRSRIILVIGVLSWIGIFVMFLEHL